MQVSLFSTQSFCIVAHRYCLVLENLDEIHGEFIAGWFWFWKSPGWFGVFGSFLMDKFLVFHSSAWWGECVGLG